MGRIEDETVECVMNAKPLDVAFTIMCEGRLKKAHLRIT